MQANDHEGIIQSRPVLEMLTVANEYCLFFEKADAYQPQDILSYFRRIAPLLYLKASMLPDIIPPDDAIGERFVTEEQWENIFKSLSEKMGPEALYHFLDDNLDIQQASLADNMADIYQDMKDFVMLFQKNHFFSREVALATFQDLFQTHWGAILLIALKACHDKAYSNVANDGMTDNDYLWEM